MPERVQRTRKAGWRMPEGAVYVGRGTPWGNPARLKPHGAGWVLEYPSGHRLLCPTERDARLRAVAVFTAWLTDPAQADLLQRARAELAGKPLACWCGLDQPCHADVLLEIVNMPQEALT